MRSFRLVAACAVVLVLAVSADAAAAKAYRATRFDVRLDLATDGSMVVTERVVFAFGPDSFTTVFRELPPRRTDGITVLSAGMDGMAFNRGENPGQYDTRRGDNGKGQPRVTWHFTAVKDSTHTFELTYRVAGIIIHSPELDLLEWRILPTRHEYSIGCSSVEVVPPSGIGPVGAARFDPPADRGAEVARPAFERCQFERDQSWQIAMDFPSGTLATMPARWQQTAERGRRWAPVFGTVAGVFLLTGIMGVFFYWNNHRPALASSDKSARRPTPPSDLPVAIAGVLTRTGASPSWGSVVAIVLDLARRDILRIEETPKKWGQRQFQVVKIADPQHLWAHERVVMDMLFTTRKGPVASVQLADLRRTAPRHWKTFRRELREDLRTRGLVSAERERSVTLIQWVGVGILIVAGIALAGAAFAVNRYQGWPLLVPFSLVVVAVSALAVSVGLTPLSDDGLRQAAAWKAFGGFLRDVGRGRSSSLEPLAFADFLPYAAAFGSALGWAKRLKKSGGAAAPAWIQSAYGASGDDMAGVIAVLSSVTAAGGHVDGGAAAAGAAGAAGGGASGAH